MSTKFIGNAGIANNRPAYTCIEDIAGADDGSARSFVLVHREMEFPPVGATTSCPGCRGIVPRRFVASVPIPERLMGSV
jgi:hypothetical protein